MKFQIDRETLLAPLSHLMGVVEKRQTMPILSNVLMRFMDDSLEMTATDTEVQLVARLDVAPAERGEVTVPARKLLDIFRLLPDQSRVNLSMKGDRLIVQAGTSRFSLTTLPVESYPAFDMGQTDLEVTLPAQTLRIALEKTLFAIAQQDVRYYLKGLLLDLEGVTLRTVASDGHRLAVFQETLAEGFAANRQIIVPRKGVLELYRLLNDAEEEVTLQISPNSLRANIGRLSFSTKLIEGRYPDYRRVLPSECATTILVERDLLRSALGRVGLMTNEKQKSISLDASAQGDMILTGQSSDQDDAEERLSVRAEGGSVSVGFNSAYLIEAISHVSGSELRLSFTPTGNSCLVEDPDDPRYRCVVMPMRL